MHPLLAGRLRLALYLAGWVPLAALLATALDDNGVSWSAAFVVTLPMGLVWGFVCLTSFYLCHAVPLRLGNWSRLVGTHVGTALVSAGLWVLAGRAWITLTSGERVARALADNYWRFAPILLAVGALAFLLSAAIHYGVTSFEASRHAEKRAFEFELLSRDAELKTLRAQIHPHFLFNALNSINALIASDAQEARRVCVLLGEFLRSSLTLGGRQRVPFEEELELAERLLAIEKVRFGARLTVELRVEAAARGCPVPPLILQPLVENAITHGIAHLLEGGVVLIEARCVGERLHLAVENPRDPEARRRKGTGVGLANVRKRVAALYGREGVVSVRDSPSGFRVELALPREVPQRG